MLHLRWRGPQILTLIGLFESNEAWLLRVQFFTGYHLWYVHQYWGQREGWEKYSLYTHSHSGWVYMYSSFCLYSITRHKVLSPSPRLAEGSDRKWHVLVTTSLPYELLNPHSKNLQRTFQRVWTGQEANACDTHWRILFLVNNSSANMSYPKERHILLFIFMLSGRSHRQYYYLPTAALTWDASQVSSTWYKKNPGGYSEIKRKMLLKAQSSRFNFARLLQQKVALYSVVLLILQKTVQIV